MLTATETEHTMPTSRAVFAHAKIVHVMEGVVEVATGQGTYRLTEGMAVALGSERWCQVRPISRVRLWTVYANRP